MFILLHSWPLGFGRKDFHLFSVLVVCKLLMFEIGSEVYQSSTGRREKYAATFFHDFNFGVGRFVIFVGKIMYLQSIDRKSVV